MNKGIIMHMHIYENEVRMGRLLRLMSWGESDSITKSLEQLC